MELAYPCSEQCWFLTLPQISKTLQTSPNQANEMLDRGRKAKMIKLIIFAAFHSAFLLSCEVLLSLQRVVGQKAAYHLCAFT